MMIINGMCVYNAFFNLLIQCTCNNLTCIPINPIHILIQCATPVNSCFKHNYAVCLVICHNGIIYQYKSNQEVPPDLYERYVQKYKSPSIQYISSYSVPLLCFSISFALEYRILFILSCFVILSNQYATKHCRF